ncbi:MAG: flagellar hook-basal body protein [Alicyclobacillus sp.]|nr:flagellar hook-basal body protein [Alicyclobacillus sp.]
MQASGTSLNAMEASQTWLDTIADNLANVSTPGFAAGQVSFQDTLTAALSGSATGGTAVAGRMTPPGWWIGTGVLAAPAQRDFSQMQLQQTGVNTDLAINGQGFFVIAGPGGQRLLTKAGDFTWSAMGNGRFALATPEGYPVLDTAGQPIEVAPGTDTGNLSVAPDGAVTVGGVQLGQRIAIAEVTDPADHLTALNDNLFAANPGVQVRVVNDGAAAGAGGGARGAGNGPGSAGQAAAESAGTIAEGFLSQSNVDMTKAMVDMIQAQRMFDLNAEALQMTSTMNQATNNLHT